MNLTNVHPADLAEVLRSSARTPAESAGVELLALHGHWLTRPDFVADGLRGNRETGAVHVAWRELGRFMYRHDGRHLPVLKLACVLAGELPSPSVGKGWTVGSLLADLADDQAALDAASVALLGLTQGRWAA